MCAVDPSVPRLAFQAEIVPLRSAKMKLALNWLPAVRWKASGFVLETCPVGPWGPVAVVGMSTVKTGTGGGGLMSMLSVTEERVAELEPWLETQKGLPVLNETPQGFTKCGSVASANPGMSETRFV